ncbi:MAG: DUF1611 domain-containing protein [Anaerolineae bacterium]|nr:DUF1611 domain-containing protein [Gemmatimonadaceae bacterium]
MSRDLKFVALAEGLFGPLTSKTAASCIRYTPERVVAVLDSSHAGETAQDVLGFGGAIPIVASLQESFRFGPNALLIGIAPQGGKLPESWRDTIRSAIEQKLDIWSGLHTFISEDTELAQIAAASGVEIHDLRKPPGQIPVSRGLTRDTTATIVLTVGTDCNIGKMTSALQLRDGLKRIGRRVAFAGTGQTGILIEGWGISVDAVVADFIGGAAEQLTLDAAKEADIVLVEGQGSLIHPSYSGVTLGLMHGSLPHAMVMCAQPSRTHLRNHDWVKIPPLTDLIRLHETMAAALRPAPVLAVALNTYDLSDAEAKKAIARAAEETGLPATDAVRYDPAPIVDALEAFHQTRLSASSVSA